MDAKNKNNRQDAFFPELIAWIKKHKPSKKVLAKKKMQFCKKFRIKDIPTDIEIYLQANEKDGKVIRKCLQTKPIRTGSGVAVVATMTKPFNCPHGSCIYCPGGLNSFFGDVPKSYTGKEPSTMRGMRNAYDAYRIVFNRLEQYVVLGQNPDKVDQIIMGGTFTAFPKAYQEEYIYDSFKAYNDFSALFYPKGVKKGESGAFNVNKFKEFFELPGKVGEKGREEQIKQKVLKLKEKNRKSLLYEQKRNETAAIRCIGLTIETKPDWAFGEQGIELLKLGTTRIELGVQTVYDELLKFTNRGHTLEDTKRSIADLRDLGFKLNFHVMPGLPTPPTGVRISRKKDIAALQAIFADPAYKPDMLKIYPCMVMPGTALQKFYEKKKFIPLSTEEAADIIVEAKRSVPEYCRIMRIQRDIPTYATTAGVGRTNLRQYVEELAKKRDVICRCIRCREIRQEEVKGKPELLVMEYEASNGKEFFISMEVQDEKAKSKRGARENTQKLLGFARLRFPPRCLHPAITPASALIRELHVYGQAVAIGKDDKEETQHKGIGKALMKKAEEIAKENGKNKMVVISGIGVRAYYRKIGYKQEGFYMVKKL